jgi:peptidoglycan/xylan/chitin deacetylase (PgdA/CDA1 family)
MADKNRAFKLLVLMYHRIALAETDPWELCVSPENFEQQLQVLKSEYNVISIPDLLQQIADNKICRDAVSITFDDGYTDNFTNAKPLLEKCNYPATFFMATGLTGRQKLFWWDELGNIILQITYLPTFLSIKIGNNVLTHYLLEPALTTEMHALHKHWKYYEDGPTDRCNLYLKLWESLLPLSSEEIDVVINSLRRWAGANISADNLSFPMTNSQVKQLAMNELFLLGIHTITHPDLSITNKNDQVKEISGSKSDLEKSSHSIEPTILAYPYGRYNGLTLAVARRLNIAACFTTEQKTINTEADLRLLGRFQVKNWNGEEFEKQLKAWMS